MSEPVIINGNTQKKQKMELLANLIESWCDASDRGEPLLDVVGIFIISVYYILLIIIFEKKDMEASLFMEYRYYSKKYASKELAKHYLRVTKAFIRLFSSSHAPTRWINMGFCGQSGIFILNSIMLYLVFIFQKEIEEKAVYHLPSFSRLKRLEKIQLTTIKEIESLAILLERDDCKLEMILGLNVPQYEA